MLRLCRMSTWAFAVVMVMRGGSALAQYPWMPRLDPPQLNLHADGLGFTMSGGGRTYVLRPGQTSELRRNGNWDFYQDNRGNVGARFYNYPQATTQYDYRNVYSGRRTIGANPFPSNPYAPRWSYQTYGWQW